MAAANFIIVGQLFLFLAAGSVIKDREGFPIGLRSGGCGSVGEQVVLPLVEAGEVGALGDRREKNFPLPDLGEVAGLENEPNPIRLLLL